LVQQVNVTKQQFCISCLRKKNAIWPGIIKQPVSAGSHRIDRCEECKAWCRLPTTLRARVL